MKALEMAVAMLLASLLVLSVKACDEWRYTTQEGDRLNSIITPR